MAYVRILTGIQHRKGKTIAASLVVSGDNLAAAGITLLILFYYVRSGVLDVTWRMFVFRPTPGNKIFI